MPESRHPRITFNTRLRGLRAQLHEVICSRISVFIGNHIGLVMTMLCAWLLERHERCHDGDAGFRISLKQLKAFRSPRSARRRRGASVIMFAPDRRIVIYE